MKWLKSLFDPNRELVRFVHEGDSETARTLLAECKDALDRAVSGVVSEEVREVLTEDKEAKDKNGWTPLHYAAHMSHPGRMALLVQQVRIRRRRMSVAPDRKSTRLNSS